MSITTNVNIYIYIYISKPNNSQNVAVKAKHKGSTLETSLFSFFTVFDSEAFSFTKLSYAKYKKIYIRMN